MDQLVLDLIRDYGLYAIIFLLLLESIIPIIPSEPILLFTGFLVYEKVFSFPQAMIASTIGVILCAWILYYIGLNVARIKKIKDSEGLERAQNWFHNYGEKSVIFCRWVPVVRTLISVPAGMFKMNFAKYTLYSAIGSIIWNILFIYLGITLNKNWHDVVTVIDTYKYPVAIIALIIVSVWQRKNIINLYNNFFKKKKVIEQKN